jgi:hypothetical protein
MIYKDINNKIKEIKIDKNDDINIFLNDMLNKLKLNDYEITKQRTCIEKLLKAITLVTDDISEIKNNNKKNNLNNIIFTISSISILLIINRFKK